MVRRGGGNLTLVVGSSSVSFSSPTSPRTSPRRRRRAMPGSSRVVVARRGPVQIVAAALAPPARLRRTRLPKAVLGGSSPLASFRSFRGGGAAAERGRAETFLTCAGPRLGWGRVRGRGSPRSPPHAAPCVPSETPPARSKESGGRGEGQGWEAREEEGGTSPRADGGGEGESLSGAIPDARRNALRGATRERAGSAAGDAPPLLGESARLGLFLELSPAPLRSATRWRARSRASIIPPWDPPTSASVPARASPKSPPAPTRARGQDQRRRPSMRRASPPSSAARVAGTGARSASTPPRAVRLPARSSPSSSSAARVNR